MLRILPALLILAVLNSAPVAGDTLLDLGNGYSAAVDAKGVVRIRKGDAPVVREMFIGTWLNDQFSDQMKAVRFESGTWNGMHVWRGVIPREGADEHYQIFVRTTEPDDRGQRSLLLTCILDVPSFAEAKAALLIRLPIETFAGKAVLVKQVSAGTFPEEATEKPVLTISHQAQDLLVRDDKTPLLYMGREDPGDIVVQDARPFGSEAYEAQFHLMPSRSQPPTRRVLHLVISPTGEQPPVIAGLTTDRPPAKPDAPAGVPRYESLEVQADLWARFANAYDRDDIAVTAVVAQPDGSQKRVAGFLFQDFQRSLEAGREKLTPVGPPHWRARFTPTQLGEHSFRLEVKSRRGTTTSKPQSFYAVDSPRPGFIRIHSQNRRFFQFSNGTTYFGIGHNVCWGSDQRLSYDYDDFFRRMGHGGLNYTRVWMCSWDTGIEGARLDHYRLDAAWRLDYILRLAEQRGIYIKLCFDNEHDYQTPDKRALFGIWKENGGPCETVLDFFTHPVAKAAYRRRVDYILARWGYSPNIMAWELWNEMNYIAASGRIDAEDAPRDKAGNNLSAHKVRNMLTDWTREMAAYIKDRDPYEHLVTTSLGLYTVWDQIWELEDIDFTSIHAYLPNPRAVEKDEEKDEVFLVLRAGDRLSKFEKPFHVSEYGSLEFADKVNLINAKDSTGIHLKNAVWGGLFSGAAITPSNWWWKEYVHERNLYVYYSSVARFLEGLDMADKSWNRIASGGAAKSRVLGIKKSDACALWVQRRGNDWYRRVIEKQPLEPLNKVRIRVPDVEPGRYRITWWNTSEGEITSHHQAAVPRPNQPGTWDLMLEYTTGRPDIAVKAVRVKD